MNEIVMVNKTKPKSIIIDGNLHSKFKVFCKGKSIKIGGIIEDLIRLYISNQKLIQKLIDDQKENK